MNRFRKIISLLESQTNFPLLTKKLFHSNFWFKYCDKKSWSVYSLTGIWVVNPSWFSSPWFKISCCYLFWILVDLERPKNTEINKNLINNKFFFLICTMSYNNFFIIPSFDSFQFEKRGIVTIKLITYDELVCKIVESRKCAFFSLEYF